MKWAFLTALALCACGYDPDHYPCRGSVELVRPAGWGEDTHIARCDHRATMKTEHVAGGVLVTCTCPDDPAPTSTGSKPIDGWDIVWSLTIAVAVVALAMLLAAL